MIFLSFISLSHSSKSNQQLQMQQSCYFKFPPCGFCTISAAPPAAALFSYREAPSGLKHLGWNASKELLWTRRVLEKEDRKNKSVAWKQWMGHKGIKWPCVHQNLISYSAQSQSGRKQSQVTDLMLITRGLPPFRKTKADRGHYTNSILWHVRGFHLGRIVLVLFFFSAKAWLEGLLHHFKRSGTDDFYWLNILPIMTWCKTLLITWIPGHSGCNWADVCQLQGSGLDSLWRHLFSHLSHFLQLGRASPQVCVHHLSHHSSSWKMKGKKKQHPEDSWRPVWLLAAFPSLV